MKTSEVEKVSVGETFASYMEILSCRVCELLVHVNVGRLSMCAKHIYYCTAKC